MDYEIIDNFLDEETADQFENLVINPNMAMYFNSNVAHADENSGQKHFYFSHVLFALPQGSFSDHYLTLCQPILQKIPHRALIRAVVNFYARTDEVIEHGSHVDQLRGDSPNAGSIGHEVKKPMDHTVLLYCINTNNGFTRLGKKESKESVIVPSVKNRLIKFDGKIYHNSATQTDTSLRTNINFNIIE